MKICLVCSSGGHLTEMLRLRDSFRGHDLFLITSDEIFTRKIEETYHIRTYLLLEFKTMKSWFQFFVSLMVLSMKELRIFLKESPDLIISTGAEIAIPACYLGKLTGKKIVYVESLARIHNISKTGKLIYPIADVFLVQWEELTRLYPRAQFKGSIL